MFSQFLLSLLILTQLVWFNVRTSYGQITDSKRSYVGINIGTSVPMGAFASNNPLFANSGYAKTGPKITIEADVALFLKPRFALTWLFKSATYKMDAQAMLNQKSIKDNMSDLQDSTNGWHCGYYMVGGMYSLPYEKVSVDFRALIGIASVTRNEVAYTITNTHTSVVTKRMDSKWSDISFSWGFGSGIRWFVSEKVALKANVDFLFTNPTVNFTSITTTGTGSKTYQDVSYVQPISSFNINFGVCYKLEVIRKNDDLYKD